MKVRFVLVFALLACTLAGCVVAEGPLRRHAVAVVDIDVRPSLLRVVVVPVSWVGYVWVLGYWRWDGGRHVWVDGRWLRERRGEHWVPAHWEERRGRWHFEDGRWER